MRRGIVDEAVIPLKHVSGYTIPNEGHDLMVSLYRPDGTPPMRGVGIEDLSDTAARRETPPAGDGRSPRNGTGAERGAGPPCGLSLQNGCHGPQSNAAPFHVVRAKPAQAGYGGREVVEGNPQDMRLDPVLSQQVIAAVETGPALTIGG